MSSLTILILHFQLPCLPFLGIISVIQSLFCIFQDSLFPPSMERVLLQIPRVIPKTFTFEDLQGRAVLYKNYSLSTYPRHFPSFFSVVMPGAQLVGQYFQWFESQCYIPACELRPEINFSLSKLGHDSFYPAGKLGDSNYEYKYEKVNYIFQKVSKIRNQGQWK